MKEVYLRYLIEERKRWEDFLRSQNLSNPGYSGRAKDRIAIITAEIEAQLNAKEKES